MVLVSNSAICHVITWHLTQKFQVDSPRFGLVGAFYTSQDVKKGQELTSNYGYSLNDARKWYRDEWAKLKLNSNDTEYIQMLESLLSKWNKNKNLLDNSRASN